MKRLGNLFAILLVCCVFTATASAAITPGTYNISGGAWFSSPNLIPTPGNLFAMGKAPTDWAVFGLNVGGFTIDGPWVKQTIDVPVGQFLLAAPAFGQNAHNISPFSLSVQSMGPVDNFTLVAQGTGTLNTGQDFTLLSIYQGSVLLPYPDTGDGIGGMDTDLIRTGTLTTEISVVPVPGAFLLAGLGSGFVGYMRRRRSL